MPRCFTASSTLAVTRSWPYSGVCTPTTTSPLPEYFSCHALTCGTTWMQLMQSNVQNSTSTGLPRSDCIVSGLLLIQWSMPWNSGAGDASLAADWLDERLAAWLSATQAEETRQAE